MWVEIPELLSRDYCVVLGESKPPLTTVVALARLYDVDPTELLLRVAAMTRRSSGARAVNIPPEWQLLAAVIQHDEALSARVSRRRAT